MAEQQQQQGAAVSAAAAAAAGEPPQVHSDAALLDFLSSLLDYTPTVSDTNFWISFFVILPCVLWFGAIIL
jgi:hypothetical protein